MTSPLLFMSSLLWLLAVACFAFVLLHAFGRSVGTGMMVLCLPFYVFVYGFTQFEHRRKGLLLAGCFGFGTVALVLRMLVFVAPG